MPYKNWKLIALVAVGIFLSLLLFFYNPEQVSFYPRCPFLLLTGYQCAGCGSLRFTHRFLHGDFIEAWHYNPVVYFAIPFILFVFVVSSLRKRKEWAERAYRRLNSSLSSSTLFILVLTWWVLRNIY